MPGPVLSSAATTVAGACDLARQLHRILEEEFAALGVPDLSGFEKLQPLKEQILATLGGFMKDGAPAAAALAAVQSEWAAFEQLMLSCRDAHRRNDILIRSKLESIRAALQVLQGSDTSGSVEVYDRLGRMSGSRRRRGYEDA